MTEQDKKSHRRAAVGAAADARRVVVGGVELAYDDSGGDGPVLLCLHAIGHGAGDYRPLAERLRGRARVIAVDWPGHGRSQPDPLPFAPARLAELLDLFVAALGLVRPIVVANSVGGPAAVRWEAAQPGRAAALVLIDPGGLDPGGRLARGFIGCKRALFAAGARGAAWFPRVFRWYCRLILPRPAAAGQRARIADSALEIAPRLAEAWASFGQPEWDLRPLAPSVRCPVLFAWSRGDWVNQLRRCRAGMAQFADWRLETFAGGHAPQLEEPDRFAEVLWGFASEVAGRSTGRAS